MNGERILSTAREHVGESYVFGVLAPKSNANWTGPWDCAEFVSWCVFQATGRLYGCGNNNGNPVSADAYTGFWHRDAIARGHRITVAQAAATPGAALLRIPRTGRIGHIVISDGHGGTVEAHSPTRGVIAHRVGGRVWDMGVLVPGVDYEASDAVPDVAVPTGVYRVRSPFMRGPEVERIQKLLKVHGIDPGPIDGAYGPATAAAVLAFQRSKGLVPDGQAGPETIAALEQDGGE
jgi:hypothetical protein